MYNVCYHSMAKSENGPESSTPDHSLSATLMVNENSENEVISSESKLLCALKLLLISHICI